MQGQRPRAVKAVTVLAIVSGIGVAIWAGGVIVNEAQENAAAARVERQRHTAQVVVHGTVGGVRYEGVCEGPNLVYSFVGRGNKWGGTRNLGGGVAPNDPRCVKP